MTTKPQLTVAVRNFAQRPPDDWRHILDQARAAEDAGIDRIFVSDHVVFGPDLSAYGDPRSGGRDGGKQPTSPDGDWIEALTALTAMSAVTERVKLATNVLVAPLRQPVLLAKIASSIDAISHGRLELGVGIGWQRAEYAATGIDFGKRGKLLDEGLETWRRLWTQTEVSGEGDGFTLDRIHMMPKPVRAEGVPVWIGGTTRPEVARRIARYGSGWIPWGVTNDEYVDAVAAMRTLVEAEGGDFDRIQVAYPLSNAFLPDGGVDYATIYADVARLVDSGISDFRTMLRLPTDYDGALAMLSQARERFDEAVG